MKAFLAVTLGCICLVAAPARAETPTGEQHAAASPQSSADLLNQALAPYAAFQADIGEINKGSVKTATDLERVLDKAARLNRDEISRGVIAYGALTAARNPLFVAEVRKAAAAWGRDRMVTSFLANKSYATTLPGGDKALEYVQRAASADSGRILLAGDAMKDRARAAQGLAWGKQKAGAAAPRTARLKRIANQADARPLAASVSAQLRLAQRAGDPGLDPTSFGGASFWRALHDKDAPTASLAMLPQADSAAYTWGANTGGAGIRAAMVTAAALYAIDAVGERPAETEKLLNNRSLNGCLQGAQLQFYQCVASAEFNYENFACVGEAGLQTVGKCVKDASK